MTDVLEKSHGDYMDDLSTWIETVINQKSKKILIKDFSDAVLAAEILKVYYPRFVEIHNYSPASSFQTKRDNWNTLNWKVLAKIDMKLSKETINSLANGNQTTIENFLNELKMKVTKINEDKLTEELELNSEESELQNSTEGSVEQLSMIQNIKRQINSCFKWLLDQVCHIGRTVNIFKFYSVENNLEREISKKSLQEEVDAVSHQLWEEIKDQLHEKEQIICTLNQRLASLENSMREIDITISNLTGKVHRNTASVNEVSKSPTSNNKKIRTRQDAL